MKPCLTLAYSTLVFFCIEFISNGEDAVSTLKKLEENYAERGDSIRQPIALLNEKYREALTALGEALRDNGDLSGFVAVRTELQRFEVGKSPAAKGSDIESLARIQTAYKMHHEASLALQRDKLDAAKSAFRDQLEELMRLLTTEKKLDEATEILKVIESLEDGSFGRPSWETGLVLHFRFDSEIPPGEPVPDASGSGNNGRLKGDAHVRMTPGIRGFYLDLDGKGDCIQCSHSDSLSLSTDCTIALWLRPRDLQDLRGLVCKYIPHNAYTFRIFGRGQNARLGFGDWKNDNRSKSTLVMERWTHVAVTLTEGKVKFYFDGVLDYEGMRPKQVPLAQNKDPVRIGSDYDGRYFNGEIDNVRIYNRALSAEEIAQIFKAES